MSRTLQFLKILCCSFFLQLKSSWTRDLSGANTTNKFLSKLENKYQNKNIQDRQTENFAILTHKSGSVTRLFGIFLLHESNPSGPLINCFKWFFLKIRFRSRYLNFKWLRTDYHCVESENWIFENPKLANTAWSQALRRLTLRGVRLCTVLACAESNNFWGFSKISISREFWIHLSIFRNICTFEKFSKVQNWLRLRRVTN